MTFLKRPIQLKTITSLLLMFFFGSALIFSAYYALSYSTLQDNKAMRFEIEQLDMELTSLDAHQVRLTKTPFPTNAELLRYAALIPKDREVLRFMRSLDTEAKRTGLIIHSLQINENAPITSDPLHKLLIFLEERTESLPPEAMKGKAIDIIGNLMAQMDTGDSTTTPAAPVDEGPLQRVILTLEYSATDQQLFHFLNRVRQLKRTTYIDFIEGERDAEGSTLSGSINITIFYYEGDFAFIPSLPKD